MKQYINDLSSMNDYYIFFLEALISVAGSSLTLVSHLISYGIVKKWKKKRITLKGKITWS